MASTRIGPAHGVGRGAALLGHEELEAGAAKARWPTARHWATQENRRPTQDRKGEERAGQGKPIAGLHESKRNSPSGLNREKRIFLFYFIFKSNSNMNQIKFEHSFKYIFQFK